ncbi:protoheme IX farnesyltransferase [Saccharicrinis fermentans]|uniref:Protoheme IX farnesyltransferase n=1 Tax=Saccharicrinis fermentans DSM 9555 = JCM 21142 TaxID=869213 RepID=W7Y3J7_9BACT|nr:protoheme IX farnesyltransferase [Saccharicrinis fermentans]GAF02582.1 protoheme IX farnesyltransferase 2 [Saccharicrinis fermentans DSM 9555 = JCM 21142]
MIALKEIQTFGKFSISIPIALTAYAGYVVFDERLSWEGLVASLGIFFLSAGASAINQLQEIKLDAQMDRTRKRPLPTGIISKSTGIAIILSFVLAGTLCLYSFGWPAVIWGFIGLFWYNIIYTPMKTRSAFSVFPGAIVGAIPPIAGWVAAGGSILDARIHFLAFFFFLGQMPHFWLLVLKYKDQYKKAGFPVITDVLTKKQVIRINLIWFLATYISALFLPAFHLVGHRGIIWPLTISSVIMMAWSLYITIKANKDGHSSHLRKMFIYFNSFYLWVMILIYVDNI